MENILTTSSCEVAKGVWLIFALLSLVFTIIGAMLMSVYDRKVWGPSKLSEIDDEKIVHNRKESIDYLQNGGDVIEDMIKRIRLAMKLAQESNSSIKLNNVIDSLSTYESFIFRAPQWLGEESLNDLRSSLSLLYDIKHYIIKTHELNEMGDRLSEMLTLAEGTAAEERVRKERDRIVLSYRGTLAYTGEIISDWQRITFNIFHK